MPEFKTKEEYEKWKAEREKAIHEQKSIKSNVDIDEMKDKKKSGLAAAGLNLLLPGLGYFYCKSIGRGIMALAVFIAIAIMVTFNPLLFPLLSLSVLFFIDGFLIANHYNKKLDARINAAMKACPQCAEKVLPAAKVCRYCGFKFATR